MRASGCGFRSVRILRRTVFPPDPPRRLACLRRGAGDPEALLYTSAAAGPPAATPNTTFRPDPGPPRRRCEEDLPAERAPQEAAARVPRADVDARRARDPEAAAGEGPEAPLGLTGQAVTRRHRLSRSRDFDAVYRKGRSVSTRFLVLYSFPRPPDDATGDARVGLAVSRKVGGAVVRNRLKRRLRAAFDELAGAAAPDHDYVLVARPGLAEAAEAKGFDWLRERVAESFRLADDAQRKAVAP
jgi:ribonuclease P protein component